MGERVVAPVRSGARAYAVEKERVERTGASRLSPRMARLLRRARSAVLGFAGFPEGSERKKFWIRARAQRGALRGCCDGCPERRGGAWRREDEGTLLITAKQIQ